MPQSKKSWLRGPGFSGQNEAPHSKLRGIKAELRRSHSNVK
jgi:hypothetical protein